MKKLITLILLVLVCGHISSARSQGFASVKEATQKLATYQPKDLEGDRQRLKTGVPMKIDEMYFDLARANTIALTEPMTEDLAFEMERVAVITLINNPMGDGPEKILEAYIKHTDLFTRAAELLDPYDEKVILQTLKGFRKAQEHGEP
jgi:hypothetical protein